MLTLAVRKLFQQMLLFLIEKPFQIIPDLKGIASNFTAIKVPFLRTVLAKYLELKT